MNNYWIHEKSLIFTPDFDEPLNKYFGLIKKSNKLIFSNYNDLDVCIKSNNCFSDNLNNYNKSKFNKKFQYENKFDDFFDHFTFFCSINHLIIIII